jgi:hypothetical protein
MYPTQNKDESQVFFFFGHDSELVGFINGDEFLNKFIMLIN